MTITARAVALLDQVPDSAQRRAFEISIQTLRGLAAFRLLGAGTEAKTAFQRAYALLGKDPEHPMRGRLLHAFGFMLCLRAEYDEAIDVADRAERLGSATNDPVLLSTACNVHGEVDQLQGRWPSARRWLERGLSLAERVDVRAGEFLVDPQVGLLAMLSVPLLHVGLVEDARTCLDRARARARERGWPMARLVALWHEALLEVRLRHAEPVAALAEEMRLLVDEFALAHGGTAARWFRGWAQARMGQPREGYRMIRDAFEENTRLGMKAGGSETLGYAVEALILAGDLDAAQRDLDEALQFAAAHGERVYIVQLYLAQAAIARAQGDAGRTRAALERAAAEARRDEAPWLEQLVLKEGRAGAVPKAP